MRRYIHHCLAEEQDIITVSEGEGKWRKVVIKISKPEDKAQQKPEQIPSEKPEQAEISACVLTAERTNCPAY